MVEVDIILFLIVVPDKGKEKTMNITELVNIYQEKLTLLFGDELNVIYDEGALAADYVIGNICIKHC